MTQPSPDFEARLAAVEQRLEIVAEDAAAARHLAAARDRDLADLGVKVDANRSAINALGEQTAGRFERLERRFDGLERRFDGLERRFDGLERRFDGLEGRFDGLERKVDVGFAEMRATLDRTAAGQQQIVTLLDTLIARDDDA